MTHLEISNLTKDYPTVYRGGKNQLPMKTIFYGREAKDIHPFKYCNCGAKICLRAERCKSCSNKFRAGTYHFSDEAKKHFIEVHYSKTDPEKAKKTYEKIAIKNTGTKRTETVKKKMSILFKEEYRNGKRKVWMKGLTKETDERILKMSEKIREYRKGRIASEETRRKMRNNHKGMLGKKHSIEACIKMSKNHSDISGDKNPNWKGGISKFKKCQQKLRND